MPRLPPENPFQSASGIRRARARRGRQHVIVVEHLEHQVLRHHTLPNDRRRNRTICDTLEMAFREYGVNPPGSQSPLLRKSLQPTSWTARGGRRQYDETRMLVPMPPADRPAIDRQH